MSGECGPGPESSFKSVRERLRLCQYGLFQNGTQVTAWQLVSGRDVSTPVTNPIGCNVKWDGMDPHWMPPEACDLI